MYISQRYDKELHDQYLGKEREAEEVRVLGPAKNKLNLQNCCPAAGWATFILHASI